MVSKQFLSSRLGRGWICLWLVACMTTVRAGTLLIWPIHPVIEADQSAAALWLENRSDESAVVQLRILRWIQENGEDVYFPQDHVVGSPPMMEIAPGQRQLIRLIRLRPTPVGTEQTWRLILDEIPMAGVAQALDGAAGGGVQLQMRYSLPLFGYGEGFDKDAANSALSTALAWRVVQENGQRFMEVVNRGNSYARLTQVVMEQPTGRESITSGLLGYVLAGGSRRWPMSAAEGELMASINGGAPQRIARLPAGP